MISTLALFAMLSCAPKHDRAEINISAAFTRDELFNRESAPDEFVVWWWRAARGLQCSTAALTCAPLSDERGFWSYVVSVRPPLLARVRWDEGANVGRPFLGALELPLVLRRTDAHMSGPISVLGDKWVAVGEDAQSGTPTVLEGRLVGGTPEILGAVQPGADFVDVSQVRLLQRTDGWTLGVFRLGGAEFYDRRDGQLYTHIVTFPRDADCMSDLVSRSGVPVILRACRSPKGRYRRGDDVVISVLSLDGVALSSETTALPEWFGVRGPEIGQSGALISMVPWVGVAIAELHGPGKVKVHRPPVQEPGLVPVGLGHTATGLVVSVWATVDEVVLFVEKTGKVKRFAIGGRF